MTDLLTQAPLSTRKDHEVPEDYEIVALIRPRREGEEGLCGAVRVGRSGGEVAVFVRVVDGIQRWFAIDAVCPHQV